MTFAPTIVDIAYLVAAIMFIVGLKRLSSPATARSGNLVAAAGMLIALAATFLNRQLLNLGLVGAGIVIGCLVGSVLARKVKMTAVPQAVAMLNGMGGGAAALVAIAELFRGTGQGSLAAEAGITILLGTVIGGITFSGSMVAFAKLQGLIGGQRHTYPFQKAINGLLLLAIVVIGIFGIVMVRPSAFVSVLALSLLLGIGLVIPIGGADMPVVISMLNSFTGLAVATTGFVLQNNLLIIAGTLVGASGMLLTQLMSKAMNRSLANVLFGAFGGGAALSPIGGGAHGAATATIRETTVTDAAILLAYARNVIIVPGYGMAVAQAQHEVRELVDNLEKRGVNVKYAIHPVAGRMPGHMNVLLAEANVPYTQLYDMEAINPEFSRADVALVIGANDVTNPAARTSPGSPIYGMPILDVDQAANVIVIKRSMKPGFAGIDNDLYLDPKTMMLFGDAKDVATKLKNEVKAV